MTFSTVRSTPRPAADRVVIVVFDGLRPDMIAGAMPHLETFAGEAVRFTESRSVFPTLTRVATSSLATGSWPSSHGIVGNAFHQPAIIGGRALDTSNFGHLIQAREAWGGRVQTTGSLAERLAAAGRRFGTVHGGSAGAAFLLNPQAGTAGHWTFSAHGEDNTLTPEAVRRAVAAFGPLPGEELPKFAAVDYARRIMVEQALVPGGAEVVLVWFPEPDTSYHYRQLGSAATRAVMAAVDRAFGDIVDAARSGPEGSRTAILAVSDHGQISTTGLVDIEARMRADGLAAGVKPDAETRIGLTLGASGEARILKNDPGLARALGRWLMEQDEIGMVFARDDVMADAPGALPLSAVASLHPRSPEYVYVMRSDNLADQHGLPGRGLISGGVPVGGGMHGGLNRHELATVLMVSAPDAPRGVSDDRPCGLVDIAPTVLALLGLDATGMDGRPLPLDHAGAVDVQSEILNAESGSFAQFLKRRSIAGRVFLEEGGRQPD